MFHNHYFQDELYKNSRSRDRARDTDDVFFKVFSWTTYLPNGITYPKYIKRFKTSVIPTIQYSFDKVRQTYWDFTTNVLTRDLSPIIQLRLVDIFLSLSLTWSFSTKLFSQVLNFVFIFIQTVLSNRLPFDLSYTVFLISFSYLTVRSRLWRIDSL